MSPGSGKNIDRLVGSSPDAVKKAPVDSREVSEVQEGTEAVDLIGDVTEGEGKVQKKASSGLPTGGTTATVGERTKNVVLPKLDVMRVQISTRIKKEILQLEKEATRIMRNPGKFEPFRLNLVVARIRSLRELLASLAHATTETLKTLWKKYVSGKS